jgi:tubulin gamma
MIANHTSMAQLFRHTVVQYDKLKKRNAFLDQYRKEPMFANGLEEFDDARQDTNTFANFLFPCLMNCREVVEDLIEEYKAAESPDYVNWGETSAASVPNTARDTF